VAAAALQLPTYANLPIGGFLSCGSILLAGALLTPRFVHALHRLVAAISDRVGSLELRTANDNLRHDVARTSVTAAALMVTVSLATAFAVFIGSFVASTLEWIDQSVPADLFITSAAKFGGRSSVPMSPDLGTKLAGLPGVADVEPARITEADYRGSRVQLLALDTAVYTRHSHMTMVEGSQEEALARVRQGAAAIVSDNFARRFGVHRGDRISLNARNAKLTLEVSGVMVDYTSDLGTILVDRAVYVQHWDDRRVDVYKLYAQPSQNLAMIRDAAMTRYGERYDLFVMTNREFKDDVIRLLEQLFSIMRALEGVALIIAVFGVVNSLSASVLDRVRDIGVLRAVGMLSRQLRKVLILEAALIGIIGSAIGVLVGLVLGYVLLRYVNLVHTGWHFPYRPRWFALAGMSTVVIIASAAAGWYPGRMASGLRITEALARD
jgi:putative ABC transport system permease protein